VRIELLVSVKWEFIGLERELKRKVARRIRRLPIEYEGADIHRLVGTDHLFRLRVAGCRILFHRKAEVITLLAIGGRYTEAEIDELVANRRAALEKA
jgi:hypothetical protein